MTVSIRASLMLSALAMAALTAAFVDAPEDAKPADDQQHDHKTVQPATELTPAPQQIAANPNDQPTRPAGPPLPDR